MAVHAIEWRISQRLVWLVRMNWDHFLNGLLYFRAYFIKFIFTAYFGPDTFVVG